MVVLMAFLAILFEYIILSTGMSGDGSHSNPNFTKLSKLIESNRIQVSLVQQTMRKEVERSRQIFRYPAVIGRGVLHRHAAKFGFRKDLKGEIPIVCPCCRMRMDGEAIPICYGTSQSTLQVENDYQEFKLPAGVAVFFSILKATLIYLLILNAFAIYGFLVKDMCQIQDLYSGFSSQDCLFGTKIDSSNQLIISILFLAALLVSIIFFIIYRKSKNQWHRFIYSKHPTEESYALLISNIPVLDFPRAGEGKTKSQFFYRKHLQDYLEQKVRTWAETSDTWQRGVDSNEKDYLEVLQRNEGALKSQSIVKSISLCYNLNRLQILDDTRTALIQKHTGEQQGTTLVQQPNLNPNLNNDDNRFSTLPKKIDFITDCRIVLTNQYASDNSFLFNLTHFVGHAFVSFQYQHYRNYFLEEYERNPKGFLYNGNLLKFAPAAEPADVNWKNLRFGVMEKQRLQLNSYFIILLIILVQMIVLFAINVLLYNVHSLKDLITALADLMAAQTSNQPPNIFIITASLVIVLTNTVLKWTISGLVAGERHKTRVNETTTYMNKSVMAQVISACLPLFLLDILLGTHRNLHYYGNTFIAISSIIQLLYQLIHPAWIGREVRRWWRYRGKGNNQTVAKFQCQLNKEFQYPQFQLSKRYSYYLYKIGVALFFAYPAPLGLLITLVTLSIMYWIDKMNLFTRSSLYYPGNLTISNHALKILQFSLLFYSASVFFFSSSSQNSLNALSLIGVGISFLFVLFVLAAPKRMERWVFGRQIASDRFIYDDCVSDGKFGETYWSRNPATMLVEEQSVTGKEMVTNPALMRRFAEPIDYPHLL